MNVTFGNATELIIGIFALRTGLIGVVKASIMGSIIGNLLLVLGTAMFVGGAKHKKQILIEQEHLREDLLFSLLLPLLLFLQFFLLQLQRRVLLLLND